MTRTVAEIWNTRAIALVLVAMVFPLASAVGSQAELPLVSLDTLEGAWEAVYFDDLRVVRLDVRRTGTSFVAMTVGRGRPLSALYRVEKSTASQGQVRIRAVAVGRPTERLEIAGKGRAIEEGGHITATVTLFVDNRAINQWDLEFEKGGEILEEVAALARVAKQVVSNSGAAAGGTKAR